MMNIVIAPDSFKGSLTATQASKIMRKAVLEIVNGCEGTLDSLLASSNGVRIPISCTGPTR